MKKCIAHRGFSSRYPENTMPAFEKAAEIGADGAEFDVQLTKDGVPVIFHDESLKRITGCDALVSELRLEELRTFDVSGRFQAACGPQAVPTLEAYCRFAAGRDFWSVIELKTAFNEYPGIEEKVIALVRAFGLEERVILSSFNHYSLLRSRAIAPELPHAILYECRIAEPQSYARALGMDYLHPYYKFLNDSELRKYEAAGIKTNPWTVDEEADMRYFLGQENVFAIMSNRPDLLMAVRSAL
ncbi:MAG: glycerophosphodiester phosphodiesterase [Clostridia bacterium]|nr:glycerophosphodiester phosphodiesterase [Clostridia bacterium]